jgi:hypothetical protein
MMSGYNGVPKTHNGEPFPWRKAQRLAKLRAFLDRMAVYELPGCAKCEGVVIGLRVPKRHQRNCKKRGFRVVVEDGMNARQRRAAKRAATRAAKENGDGEG